MARLSNQLASYFFRRHRLVLPVVLVGLTVFLGLGLRNFSLDAAAESLTLKGDADLVFYNETRRDLSSDEYVIVSLSLAADASGDWFDADRIAYLSQFSADLAAVHAVDHITSAATIPLLRSPLPLPPDKMKAVRANVMMLMMDPSAQEALTNALSDPVTLASGRADMALARDELTHHAAAQENLISADGRTLQLQVFIEEYRFGQNTTKMRADLQAEVTRRRAEGEHSEELARLERELVGLNTQYIHDYGAFGERRRQAVLGIIDVVEKHRAAHAEYQYRLSGLPTLVEEMVDSLGHDMRVFGIASAGFVALVLLLVFRRVRWVLVPLVIGTMVVVWILGAMSHQHIRITLVTANIASLLFIITMAHSIHLVVRFRELQAQALDFGWWMAIGTMAALFASFLAFPAFMLLVGIPSPPTAREAGRQPVLRFFAVITLRGYRVIPVFGLALVVIAVLGIQQLVVEMKLIDYFKATSPTHQGLKFIDKEMGGTTTLEVIIESPEEGYFHKHASISRMRSVIHWLDSRREIGNVMSALAYLDEVVKLVPHDFVKQLAIERMKDTELKDFISPDGRRFRIVTRVRETIADLDREKLLDDTRAYLAGAAELEGLRPRITGIFVLYTNMLGSLIDSQIKSFQIVAAVVTIMLAVVFLSPTLALIGMIPTLVPVALVLGVMGLVHIPLNLVTVMIASVSLGIGVDGAIHYVSRYRRELAATDGDFREALRRSHQSIGLAILATAFAVIGGTWLMMLSDFVPTIWFGLFTGLALLAALFGALTILPSFLLLLRPFGKWRRIAKERAKEEAGASSSDASAP